LLLEEFNASANGCLRDVQTLSSARETSTGDNLKERLGELDIHASVIAENLHSNGN
jgi:hypothetical protein